MFNMRIFIHDHKKHSTKKKDSKILIYNVLAFICCNSLENIYSYTYMVSIVFYTKRYSYGYIEKDVFFL